MRKSRVNHYDAFCKTLQLKNGSKQRPSNSASDMSLDSNYKIITAFPGCVISAMDYQMLESSSQKNCRGKER